MGTVKYKTRSANPVGILGTTEAYLPISGVGVAQGRFLTAADAGGGQPVCVIGSDVATNLFRGESPIGQRRAPRAHSKGVRWLPGGGYPFWGFPRFSGCQVRISPLRLSTRP